MKSIIILKGGSAAGKGTRVCQLMEYLKSKGHNCTTVSFDNEGKKIALGKYFPAFELFIPGKFSISNKSGLTSWSGMDYLHGTLGTSEKAREAVKQICDELSVEHVIMEGEPMFLSDKYRPEFLKEFYEPEKIYMKYFMYQNRKQYDERIIGRSGKASGDSGWSRVANYLTEYGKSQQEAANVEGATILSVSVDEAPYVFVQDALDLLSSSAEMFDPMEVMDWCDANPMLRKVGEADPLNKNSLW